MTEAKHTPGPWWTEESGVRDRGGYICHTRPAQRYPGQEDRFIKETAERAANKALIAAAPKLLEALQITRGNIASLGPAGALTPYTPYQEWLAMVDAAIAKATGN